MTLSRSLAQWLGSRYRWIILALCSLSVFQVTFHAYAYATLLPSLRADLDISNSQVGSLLSAYFVTYGLVQVPIGYIADRLGPRRVMLSSLATFSLGVFLVPLSFSYATGLAIRLIVGLGASAIYVPGLRLMPAWFEQRRMGLVFGLISSGSALGSSIALIVIPWLAGLYGWRIGYLFAAASVPVVWLLAYLFLLRRPEEAGLRLPGTVESGPPSGPLPFLPALRRVAANRTLYPYGLATAIYYGSFAGLLAWTPTFLINDAGFDREMAGFITALYPLANIVTAPAAGALADRTGRRKAVFLGGILLTGVSATLFALIGPGLPLVGLIVMMVLFSISTSATVLPFSIVAQLVEPALYGTAVGLMNSYYFIGAVFYPILLGAVVDFSAELEYAFLAIAALSLVGVALVIPARERLAAPAPRPPARPPDSVPAAAEPGLRRETTPDRPRLTRPVPAEPSRGPISDSVKVGVSEKAADQAMGSPLPWEQTFNPQPGQRLLVAGAPLVNRADSLGRLVTPGGQLIAILPSDDLAARNELPDSIRHAEIHHEDPTRLRFFGGSFDLVGTEDYLPGQAQPKEALRELVRVTRSGGLVAVAEYDWDTFVLAAANPTLTSRLVEVARSDSTGRRLGRLLPKLLLDAGLIHVSVEPFVHTMTDAETAQQSGRLSELIRAATGTGHLSAAEVEEWLTDQRRSECRDRFLFAVTYFLASGRRP